ncbi:MAG TPA: DUF3611 family protein [Methylocella sp.]|nr:DUF3611 family protein [Methylocella sp.]
MQSNIGRYHSIFILSHWILAFLIFASLGLGWYAIYIQTTSDQTHEFIIDIHTSLGLTAAIILIILLFFRIAFRSPPYPDTFPRWQKILASSLYFLIYLSLFLILITGYLQASFRGAAVEFWGVRMPDFALVNMPAAEFLGQFWGAPLRIWGAANVTSAEFFGSVHAFMAFVLAGLIIVHIGSVTMNIFKQPGIATRMLALSAPPATEPEEPKSTDHSIIAQRLAKDLRLFGWLEFSLQLTLAIFAALLLEFATSGRAFSPNVAGFGDAIFWGIDGFLLLLLAIVMAFYYTRAARHIVLRSDSYLSKKGITAFWFLFAGLLIGLFGILISFTGVALSISLLIVKTVSQPPGIAITDPSKIVRALDVFVLLVNFILLIAHFIGAGIALWLGLSVSSSRLKYVTLSQQQQAI